MRTRPGLVGHRHRCRLYVDFVLCFQKHVLAGICETRLVKITVVTLAPVQRAIARRDMPPTHIHTKPARSQAPVGRTRRRHSARCLWGGGLF
ncbi:hypothetical protein E2C01_009696 [Portunus trituberculatus]|uniref:Uncharacterized protein n=1 Tax=Portunus trituberculatus TaxID=210409 RepID=A0A5B7D6P0_PORTR|nr:hypothetical protein [Portunus trituberculatus]